MLDTTRADMSQKVGVSADVIQRLQSGDAFDVTLQQLGNVTEALGGTLTISLNFNPQVERPAQ